MTTCPRCGKETGQPFHTCKAMTTPRTDAVWADKKQNILEHARQLETELIALQRWKEEHWDANKQQWLNSTTTVCADFPNVAEYIAQLEKERDQLLATIEGFREVVKWIASQENLFFAECTQAETIVTKCREALQPLPPTNLVKRSVLEKLANAAEGHGTTAVEYSDWQSYMSVALKEAHEELQRTRTV